MTEWRGILMATVAMTVIGQLVHTVESVLTMGYYMDPAYFAVWSKIMMPTAGPPPAEFFYYSVMFALVGWGIFGFAYEKLGRGIGEKNAIKNGLKFGAIVFLLVGISGVLTMYLLINLPTGLLAAWIFFQLVLYLIGGVVAAKLIKLK
jgi:hypothetical protein